MGQKVNPVGLRLGINRTWDSRWFAKKADYGKLLHEDIKIRKQLKKRLYQAGVSRIIIERPHKKCRITIYAARPGVIIGKKGADIDKLRKDVAAITEGEVHLNIVEIRKPETDAQLVAENIAQQLERRVAFRRAMKRSIQSAMRLGANHPMGPLQLADFIGLDTCLSIMQVLHDGLADSKYRPCPLLVKYVEAGWLGRKTQRGFYDYRGPHPVPTR